MIANIPVVSLGLDALSDFPCIAVNRNEIKYSENEFN